MNVYEKFVGVMSPYLNRELCFSFAILVLFLLVAICFKIYLFIKEKTFVLKPSHIMFVGTGMAQSAIFWQIYNEVPIGWVRAVDSIVSTIKSFGFDNPSTALIKGIFFDGAGNSAVEIARYSREYVALVSVLMISMTAIAALSIFKDTAAQLRYSFKLLSKAFVFSELNEKSICLAKDIRKKNRFSSIVFAGVDRVGSDEAAQGLVLEAENIGAIMTRKSILDFHITLIKKRNIYLIDLEESNNIKNAIELYKKYKKNNCVIHVFSTLESSETFIDGIKKEDSDKAVINLINRAQIIAYDILMRYPMYRAADSCKSNLISVLVIGAGTIGMEFAKAAMWCGIMNNYDFKIRILDSVDRENEFRMKYPCFDDELKRTAVKIDYKFGVVDVNSSEFNQMLGIYGDANYIVVATGDDEQNINVASRVRRLFRKRAIKDGKSMGGNDKITVNEPFIIPVISNADYYSILGNSDSNKNLCPYGSHMNTYNSDTVNGWHVDALARKIHELYKSVCERRKGDYIPDPYEDITQTDKRSNRANAVHVIYKLKGMGIEIRKAYVGKEDKFLKADKESESDLLSMGYKPLNDRSKLFDYLQKNENVLQNVYRLEHNRWCVFVLLDGWSSWTLDDVRKIHSAVLNKKNNKNEYSHKDKSAMLHAALVSNDELSKVGQALKEDPDNLVEFDKTVTSFIWKDENGFFKTLDSFLKKSDYALKIYYHPDMIKLDCEDNKTGE